MPECAFASHCTSVVSSHTDLQKQVTDLASNQFLLVHLSYFTAHWSPFLSVRAYNKHLTYKNAFVNDELDMAVTSICPFVLCVCVCVSRRLFCRGKGISPGWRLPALQILLEVGGKIKPSSKCQNWFRQRDTKMIRNVMISHFSSCFPIRSRVVWRLSSSTPPRGLRWPPRHNSVMHCTLLTFISADKRPGESYLYRISINLSLASR